MVLEVYNQPPTAFGTKEDDLDPLYLDAVFIIKSALEQTREMDRKSNANRPHR